MLDKMLKENRKYIIVFSVLLCFMPIFSIAQSQQFIREVWEKDRYGHMGIRSRMELPEILTESYLEDVHEEAYDCILNVLGKPDKTCVQSSRLSLFWYLEGYKNKEYFESETFEGQFCNEQFPFAISYIVFTFDCNGRYISSIAIKAGG
jgi:hypothetical protein